MTEEGYAGIYEQPDPPHVFEPDQAKRAAAFEAAHGATGPVLGPDFYHANFNDGPVPATIIGPADFLILKVSENTSYPWATSWWPAQRDRVRALGRPVGGYHFLRPHNPQAQVDFYLSHLGAVDIIPILDVEDQAISVADVKAAVARVKAAGHPGVMGYGRQWYIAHGVTHAEVGFTHAWKPRYGPPTLGEPADLWQYFAPPFPNGTNFPDGFGGHPSDMSVVLTALPLIAGGDDLAILTDEQQKYLQGALRYLNASGAPPAGADPKVKEGFNETKARIEAGGGGGGTHDHGLPGFPTRTSKAG